MPTPVIFDTDIGNDVDDTWAIAMALNCPELEVRYVLTAGPGNHRDRAKMVAKLLDTAGVVGVPIGKGCDDESAKPGNAAFEGELSKLAQSPWVDDYDLSDYAGEVFEDGVGELIRIVMDSDKPLTLIAIGPLGNVGEALRREPRIAQKLHFVGMHGAIYKGYGGGAVDPVKGWEYNVWADIPSSQATFSAQFLSMTITPLDTCGSVQLQGEKYEQVKNSRAPLARAVMENYRIWHPRFAAGGPLAATKHYNVDVESSVLFDTVAVYLAYANSLCTLEALPIEVTDDGVTRIDSGGKANKVACAVQWKDLDGFHSHLVERLCRNENKTRL